jgi:hypothetical protein
MTRFRFRYKQLGVARWRCRVARRRTLLLILPLTALSQHPASATWRRTAPLPAPVVSIATVLQVGGFMIGAEGDPQLLGHPDIRY